MLYQIRRGNRNLSPFGKSIRERALSALDDDVDKLLKTIASLMVPLTSSMRNVHPELESEE